MDSFDIPELIEWIANVPAATLISVAALLLGLLNFVVARRNERKRDELQLRNDRVEADRLLESAWRAMYGPDGFSKTLSGLKLAEARSLISQASAIAGQYAPVAEHEGYLAELDGDLVTAKRHFARALTRDPHRAGLHVCVARMLPGDEKLRALAKATKLQPPREAAWAHYEIALELEKRGDLRNACEHLSEAARLRPKHAWTHNLKARILKKLGNTNAAKASFEQAISTDPSLVDALVGLGTLLVEAGDWDEGVAWIEQAMRTDPRDDFPYAIMAALHADRNEASQAMAYYEKAVAIDPKRRLSGDSTQDLVRAMRKLLSADKATTPAPAAVSKGQAG